MNIIQQLNQWLISFNQPDRPVPGKFRRGKVTRRILGIKVDVNSRHVGMFLGGITPMKRRFKGVSRTAGK